MAWAAQDAQIVTEPWGEVKTSPPTSKQGSPVLSSECKLVLNFLLFLCLGGCEEALGGLCIEEAMKGRSSL